MDQPRPLFHLFLSFQTHNTNFTTNRYVKLCTSSIQCRESNSWPLEHESLPITTRPGPARWFLFSLRKYRFLPRTLYYIDHRLELFFQSPFWRMLATVCHNQYLIVLQDRQRKGSNKYTHDYFLRILIGWKICGYLFDRISDWPNEVSVNHHWKQF